MTNFETDPYKSVFVIVIDLHCLHNLGIRSLYSSLDSEDYSNEFLFDSQTNGKTCIILSEKF